MNTVKETKRRTREQLFGREWAALMSIQDDEDDDFEDFEDPEDSVF